MGPKSHRCDLWYNSKVIDLQTSVLNTSPQDWQLEQCTINPEAAAILRLTKSVEGLTFQFVLEQPLHSLEQEGKKPPTLQVLGPSPEPGDPPVTFTRLSSPWTTGLVSRLQCMMSDDASQNV
jgi:hypothetical protein